MPNDEKRYDMLSGDDRQEAIRIKKIKQGLIPDAENEAYQKEKAEREAQVVPFKEKAKNFWYHYKRMVLLVGFFVIAAAFLTYQGINKERYDTTVLLCSYSYYDDATIHDFSKTFSKYMTDFDGNGEVNIGVFQASYAASDNQMNTLGYEQALQSRIMAEIVSGENCIFIIEKKLMDSLAQKEVFADLRLLVGVEGDAAVYGVNLSDSELLKDKVFEKKRDDYYVALRVRKESGDKESYNAQVNAVKKLLSAKAK